MPCAAILSQVSGFGAARCMGWIWVFGDPILASAAPPYTVTPAKGAVKAGVTTQENRSETLPHLRERRRNILERAPLRLDADREFDRGAAQHQRGGEEIAPNDVRALAALDE